MGKMKLEYTSNKKDLKAKHTMRTTVWLYVVVLSMDFLVRLFRVFVFKYLDICVIFLFISFIFIVHELLILWFNNFIKVDMCNNKVHGVNQGVIYEVELLVTILVAIFVIRLVGF